MNHTAISGNEQIEANKEFEVAITELPSMTVASIHIIGQNEKGEHAEAVSGEMIDDFIINENLKEVYPNARHFGFNNPDGVPDEDPSHGYERWVSIPDTMEVPEPFKKKHLNGGMYAFLTITENGWEGTWMT